MKKLAVILLVLACNCFAEEKDCPPAAEVAETQNPNAYKDCDYSNTGLNGMLHRSWKKKVEESEEQDEIASSKSKNSSVEPGVKDNSLQTKAILAKGVFNSAQQLQTLRFALIQNALAECPKGFLLESEKYLPQADKAMKLELLYHCL